MIISSIEKCKNGSYLVRFEDGSELRSTLAAITDMRLFTGKELDAAELEALRHSSALSIAREKALEMVSRRPLSRKELCQKLSRKGIDPDISAACALWLEEHGFINDANYAAAIVRHYSAKGYGAGRIRAELAGRGIARELWDAALEQLSGQDDRLDRLIASRLTDASDPEQLRKLSSMLYRRGYSWEEIRAALSRCQALSEECD